MIVGIGPRFECGRSATAGVAFDGKHVIVGALRMAEGDV